MPCLVPLNRRPEIARRRVALGIKQTQFARMLGLAPGYYFHLDRGDRPMPAHLAKRADIILTELEAGAYRAQVRVQELAATA